VRVQARRLIGELRQELGGAETGKGAEIPSAAALADRLRGELEAAEGQLRLQRVINATGIFLHTNLGRAPLPAGLVEELRPILGGYCDLEIDLESGRRRERNTRLRALLQEMLGAPDAILVNNNAAALTLALFVLARGREVLVSRGELVEIGGSFRIPEILEAAGARLREVGSTNRTVMADYERALGEGSALLLKVFPSNYRIQGFTAEASAGELAALGKKHGIPLLVDEGSGLLLPRPRPGIAHPSLKELLEAGCDLVCASGDKLLGGPQAGILAGREDLVEACRKSPLYRALRPDRYTFAATEAILRHHRAGAALPIERLWPEPAAHQERIAAMGRRLGAGTAMVAGFIGGGCAPEEAVPDLALTLPPDEALLRELRLGGADREGVLPPVVGYLREDRLVLDLRTVDPADDKLLARAVERARAALRKKA
jgi:L-seryl-tRNA(Ser) seleniumtransferase